MIKETSSSAAYAALIGCYLIWGVFPIYFHTLDALRADEILVARIVFSLLSFLLLFGWRGELRIRLAVLTSWSYLLRCMLTGLLISLNWLGYVYAVGIGQIASASLGYFLGPIFSVILGIFFFAERLSFWQKMAVILAGLGVLLRVLLGGELPYLALMIGVSFALYGALRKRFCLGAVDGLFVEVLLSSVPAVCYWIWLHKSGLSYDFSQNNTLLMLLSLSGVLTLVPLLLFLFAAERVPLATLGLAQFLSPTLQFLLAVFLFNESFSASSWVSFVLIWAGIGLYSVPLILSVRRG